MCTLRPCALVVQRSRSGHTAQTARGVRSGAPTGCACAGVAARSGEAPDLVTLVLGEPDAAIRPGGDACWCCMGLLGRGNRELGDRASGGDACDLVDGVLSKPHS